jgi:hypothetical protein
MASALSTLKWLANVLIQLWDHDPGATTAKLVSPDGGTTIRYLDMGLYSRFAVAAYPTVIGGGGLTKLEIVASSDAAFTAPVVVKDSGVIAADARPRRSCSSVTTSSTWPGASRRPRGPTRPP